MRVLYIFPHPDDESFGPAPAMSQQQRAGHEIYLLTLTRGGATRQREKYGYSIAEMGAVRYREMQEVARTLNLSELRVEDLPDSGLKELDPRVIEGVIGEEIRRRRPHVVVTYAVHGVSGFHDHLVSHAVVKRTFVELREQIPALQRLAFFTLTQEAAQGGYFPLSGSRREEIDCAVPVDPIDIERTQRALDCYATFQETIEKTGIRDFFGDHVHFELFQESHDPPLTDLFAGLRE